MSRYNTYHSDLKITQGKGASGGKCGKAPMGAMKTANWPGLPGKAADAFKAMKKGVREVNGYAMYKGLSEKSYRQETQSRGDVHKGYERAMENEEARKEFEEGPSLSLAKSNPVAAGIIGMDRVTGGNLSKALRASEENAAYAAEQRRRGRK